MGVDTRIYLPAYVRAQDVADVLGRLVGCPVKVPVLHVSLKHPEVQGVEVKATCLTTCLDLCWTRGADPFPESGAWLFHLEYGCEWIAGEGTPHGSDGSRGLMPRARACNIAVGRALVNFFGGALTYADCDGGIDYEVPWRSPAEVCPGDGKPWDDFQDRKAGVCPLTAAEIKAEREHAAYPD